MFRLAFEIVKFLITVIGLFFGTAMVLGKSAPFHRMGNRIDRKNRRNAQRYLYN